MNRPKDQRVQAFEEGLWRSYRRLVPSGRAVLLAVSGGPYSMALLSASVRLAGRLGLRFEVATVDHSLREESAAEAAQVGTFAASLGLLHHVLRAPVSTTVGLEAAARAVRYEALERCRCERHLDVVATAHTATDQAETVLMRLTRGAALGGATSIHEARADRVIRPLLFATRDEVEAWVAALALPVAHDPMNDDPQFLRVRLRREVLPVLERAAGPHAARALARFAALAGEDEALLSDQARHALSRVSWPDGSLEAVAVAALERPIARRVLGQWLAAQGVALDAELIADALRAIEGHRTATLPGDRVLACLNGRVTVQPAPARTLHATSS